MKIFKDEVQVPKSGERTISRTNIQAAAGVRSHQQTRGFGKMLTKEYFADIC
jgi:hypothetical protein